MNTKEFGIWQSPKSYRYKEEAILNHAPQQPGIYELVTFDEQQNAKVLYAGWVTDRSIYDALFEHWNGDREPKAQELLARYPNLYFSFILDADAQSPDDWKDIYWALGQSDKPALQDWKAFANSGRYSEVTLKERSLI